MAEFDNFVNPFAGDSQPKPKGDGEFAGFVNPFESMPQREKILDPVESRIPVAPQTPPPPVPQAPPTAEPEPQPMRLPPLEQRAQAVQAQEAQVAPQQVQQPVDFDANRQLFEELTEEDRKTMTMLQSFAELADKQPPLAQRRFDIERGLKERLSEAPQRVQDRFTKWRADKKEERILSQERARQKAASPFFGVAMERMPEHVKEPLRQVEADQAAGTYSNFERRILTGEGRGALDVAKMGGYSSHMTQGIAGAFMSGNYELADQYIDRMNRVEDAAAASLPAGESLPGKAWYGLAASAQPMAESIGLATLTAGIADKPYWALMGQGEVLRGYSESTGKKISDLTPEERNRAEAASLMAGTAYAAFEYIGHMFGLQSAKGVTGTVKRQAMSKFIDAVVNDEALYQKALRGGGKFVWEWFKETGEEFLQEAATEIGEQSIDGDVDAMEVLGDATDAFISAAPATFAMTALGGGQAAFGRRMAERREAHRQTLEERAQRIQMEEAGAAAGNQAFLEQRAQAAADVEALAQEKQAQLERIQQQKQAQLDQKHADLKQELKAKQQARTDAEQEGSGSWVSERDSAPSAIDELTKPNDPENIATLVDVIAKTEGISRGDAEQRVAKMPVETRRERLRSHHMGEQAPRTYAPTAPTAKRERQGYKMSNKKKARLASEQARVDEANQAEELRKAKQAETKRRLYRERLERKLAENRQRLNEKEQAHEETRIRQAKDREKLATIKRTRLEKKAAKLREGRAKFEAELTYDSDAERAKFDAEGPTAREELTNPNNGENRQIIADHLKKRDGLDPNTARQEAATMSPADARRTLEEIYGLAPIEESATEGPTDKGPDQGPDELPPEGSGPKPKPGPVVLTNRSGKTKKVYLVKETDLAFIYRDNQGKQKRVMKTAWTRKDQAKSGADFYTPERPKNSRFDTTTPAAKDHLVDANKKGKDGQPIIKESDSPTRAHPNNKKNRSRGC